MKLTTLPLARNKSDHIKLPVPIAAPSEEAGFRAVPTVTVPASAAVEAAAFAPLVMVI